MAATLDARTLRRLAVEFEVDPRTIQKLWRGEAVRGMARDRAARALASVGIELVAAEAQRRGAE